MTKRKVGNTLTLMVNSIYSDNLINAKQAIFNINRNALYPVVVEDNKDILIALEGEVAHFIDIWNKI